MNSVSQIIFDALASRRSVVLPGVGSLEVKRRKAKKISETQIVPPRNVVVFSPDEEVESAESVVSMLASESDGSDVSAKSIYGAWFEDSLMSDGTIAIEHVGEIKDGKFFIAQPLHTALNPSLEEVVTVEKERRDRNPLWMWLLGGILAALLILCILWCWRGGMFDNMCRRGSDDTTGAVVTPVAEPAGDETMALSGDQGPTIANTPSEPRFHIIAGSFAIESNADNFAAKVRREFPELKVEKLVNPRNGNSMVSIFSAPTERQAYNKMNMYWDIDLGLWVYEQR